MNWNDFNNSSFGRETKLGSFSYESGSFIKSSSFKWKLEWWSPVPPDRYYETWSPVTFYDRVVLVCVLSEKKLTDEDHADMSIDCLTPFHKNKWFLHFFLKGILLTLDCFLTLWNLFLFLNSYNQCNETKVLQGKINCACGIVESNGRVSPVVRIRH